MDIHAKEGTKVIFDKCSKSQMNFGNNDDPNKFLKKGIEYTVLRTEVHSYHTKVFLKEFPELKVNSVCFE